MVPLPLVSLSFVLAMSVKLSPFGPAAGVTAEEARLWMI
jgi:hypothetical protein